MKKRPAILLSLITVALAGLLGWMRSSDESVEVAEKESQEEEYALFIG